MLENDDHFRLIERAVLSGRRSADDAWRTASWTRCLHNYKLDPNHPSFPQLSESEIRNEREVYDNDLQIAGLELEKTLSMIEGGGYGAQITNSNGVIIQERLSRDQTYYCSVDRIGSIWTEDIGGTNGIGTALVSERPTAVYLADHFYANLTDQACAAAPFFGPTGEIMGVVNLSTRNPGLPKLAHRVVYGIAQVTAERLEQQYFRHHYGRYHTLHLETEGHSPCILAVDDDFCIVGATRTARERFRLDKGTIGRKSLWMLFEKLRGEPTMAFLRENLRQIRPIGESATVGTLLMPPQTVVPKAPSLSVPTAVQRPTRSAAQLVAGPTLADCAGGDPVMQRNVEILRRMAGSGLHVLLLGETGVGKDTLARAFHLESDRVGGPFVAFNCAAMPETLIDSELFGYSAGAFTGASRTGSVGRIVEADRGTLFLDEIGDMPLVLQTRLLRFLETREVMPLGGGRIRTVDVQVIAATHQDLTSRVAEGSFRQDLYYRLAGVAVHVPALRERSDLDLIIKSVLGRMPEAKGMELSEAALNVLRQHEWPGNIRELRNVLSRAVRLARSGVVGPEDLLFDKFVPKGARPLRSSPRGPRESVPSAGPASYFSSAEREALAKAIEEAKGDAQACAALLGCSRATLYRKLKAHGLSLSQ